MLDRQQAALPSTATRPCPNLAPIHPARANAPLPLPPQAHEVCVLVTRRAARLTAAAIAAMLRHTGRGCLGAGGAPPQRTVVAIDGSVFKKFAKFRCACCGGFRGRLLRMV